MTDDERVEEIETAVEVEVRYAETDQMGVVHHANYLVWFELARTAHCARSGFHYAQIEEMGYLLTVTGVRARYRRGARYGDTLRVTARIERLGSRGLTFAYRVLAGDTLVADGATDHVWVDAASRRPCRAPQPLKEAFEELARG